MANHQIVNNVDHADLRVATGFGAQYGDDVMFTMTFPAEMRNVQACYPILLYRDPTQETLYPVAVFGFEQGENLFLKGDNWEAPYVPMMIRRQPFTIGLQKQHAAADSQRVLTIDLDHPRVGGTDGQALFMEQGGNSDYLENVANMMESIHQGQAQNQVLVELLLKHDLVESITLEVTLADGQTHQLQGFYTLDDEALQGLGAEALAELNSAGCLLPAYMMVASMSQLRVLIGRRNAALPGS